MSPAKPQAAGRLPTEALYDARQRLRVWAASLDRALGFPYLKHRFRHRVGYAPNLVTPRTFNEKLTWRKIHDRNPDFPILSDKYLSRAYVADRLPGPVAEAVLMPLLQRCSDPDEIDFDALPSSYVVKASHGSGMNLIVTEANPATPDMVRRTAGRWMRTPYSPASQQWFYNEGRRSILVQPLLCAPDGTLDEATVHVFHGKARLLRYFKTVDFAAGKYGRLDTTLFPDGRLAPFNFRKTPPSLHDFTLPAHIPDVIRTAEAVARDLDFVRVDFYVLPDRFHIGEFTLTPNAGMADFSTPSGDAMVGEYWDIGLRGP